MRPSGGGFRLPAPALSPRCPSVRYVAAPCFGPVELCRGAQPLHRCDDEAAARPLGPLSQTGGGQLVDRERCLAILDAGGSLNRSGRASPTDSSSWTGSPWLERAQKKVFVDVGHGLLTTTAEGTT